MPEKGKTFAGEVREETVAWSKDTYQLLKQAEQGKVKSYVQDIALAVLDCKETATSRETFIRLMNERGYGFSGYEFLAYYYVSWAIAEPEHLLDTGLPFHKAYSMARQMWEKRQK